MPNTVECPSCKRWYESNPSNRCPFCGFRATAYDHVKVEGTGTGSARGYVNIIYQTLTHPTSITVLERGTGRLVANIPRNKWTDAEEAKYPSSSYIIIG